MLWQQNNFNIKQFLKAWVTEGVRSGGLHISQRISLLRSALERAEVYTALQSTGYVSVGDISSTELIQELDTLVGQPYFNKFDHFTSMEKVDFSQVSEKIKSTAPKSTALLEKLMSNQRQGWSSYKGSGNSKIVQQQLYLITSIICRSRARSTANFFAKMLGIYLLGSGVKRQVIEVLAGLGLCDGYKYINRHLTDIANNAKEGSTP